ncbi:hypothetical protein [Candidatus Laterigemmans baculatus]|uniref:hypothetical protein n=1 Tax=Candidatus Laterigemmans baculatus TaxID=2770505 RepID=UPI0013DBBC58|nr:hypothetical protein [Candidatus Laterigemmans baculatus]
MPVCGLLGQQLASRRARKTAAASPVARPRQALRIGSALLLLVLGTLYGNFSPGFASGPLIDPLDGRPLNWRLSEADCGAEVRSHWLDATGGLDRRPCEALTLRTGNGTRAVLEYRIDPSQIIAEVKATVSVQAVRHGARVGLRVRYPRVIDPATRAPLAAILWGHTHRGDGQWEMLTATPDSTQRRLREIAIRGQFGAEVDLDDAYIDAVVINAYTGPGLSTIRLDDLRIDGLVSVSPAAAPANGGAGSSVAGTAIAFSRGAVAGSGQLQPGRSAAAAGVLPAPHASALRSTLQSAFESAFRSGRVTRILEHNGEPLDYLKMLGFDAVLLSRPPTAELLREAVRQSMIVYAPPPTAPDPALEPLLTPVAGWYLGTSLDDSQMDLAANEAERIARLPTLWQRPAMVAPAESWDRFAGVATTLVYDLPPAIRGLGGDEQTALLRDQLRRTGRPVAVAVGVPTLPPERLIAQLDAISRGLGAANVEDFGWHSIWLQTAEALKAGPQAIVFRSTRSLTSGREADLQRAAALGLVNRWLEIIGPAVAGSRPQPDLRSNQPNYHLAHMAGERLDVVIASHTAQPPGGPSPPTPPTLEFHAPARSGAFAWRLTNTAAEQLPLVADGAMSRVAIESPDWVEWLVFSDDPGLGRRLERVIRSQAESLNQERWRLVSDDLLMAREDWRSAVGGGLVPRAATPAEAMRLAANALADVQPILASGRYNTAMRATRAADWHAVNVRQALAGRLQPPEMHPTGMPTLLAPGGTVLQLAWRPILDDGRWTENLLAGGELDDAEAMLRSGWTHQKRLEAVADAQVGIDPTAGSDGLGALRIEAAAHGEVPLPGGYAGTVLRVRSGPVTVPAGSWVRIDARVRTLGFGGPHQGLLVYDSDAGSELGTLVRGKAGWQDIRLYRVVTSDRPLRVTFEGLGGGEALVDWVRVAMWQPGAGR